MLFRTPPISGRLADDLDELTRLRSRLGERVGVPAPWLGQLRREALAASARSSIAIEGYDVPEVDARAIVQGHDTRDTDDESRHALACYARAMDHVGVMAGDPAFEWGDRIILDLHFDACLFQRDKSPGRWRTGPIAVTGEEGAPPDYRGPDAADVPGLMKEVATWLESGDLGANVVVRAAMAHLHVLSVHPFEDGNGRVARIVQSLVLAREGILAHELSSIEEYLMAHTQQYYATLRETQGGSYQPDRDATKWVGFCIAAHLEQVRRRLVQIEEAAARWEALESLVAGRNWPDRFVIALEQAMFGGTDRATYANEAEVSPATASGDLRRLCDADLLEQRGRTRNIRYLVTDVLRRAIENAIASAR